MFTHFGGFQKYLIFKINTGTLVYLSPTSVHLVVALGEPSTGQSNAGVECGEVTSLHSTC